MSSLKHYDPNAPGVNNGRFMGFPFSEEEANCILLPVPWDVTTSYAQGTASAPKNILQASYQLDIGDRRHPDSWKGGIFLAETDHEISEWSTHWRAQASRVIDAWESGEKVMASDQWQDVIEKVNEASRKLNDRVYQLASDILNQDKKVLLIGGDHSTILGYIRALAERNENIGVIQIDAHCDLRNSYEGFQFSHASIMYNILEAYPQVSQLVQVGIRDYCPEEENRIRHSDGRIETYFMTDLRQNQYAGITWKSQCQRILENLPCQVYISLDIDGLDPGYCPHTGTPVPGGMEYHQVIYLLEAIQDSGRQIIGADLCEVGGLPHEWDGNVGARLAYKLALLLLNEI